MFSVDTRDIEVGIDRLRVLLVARNKNKNIISKEVTIYDNHLN